MRVRGIAICAFALLYTVDSKADCPIGQEPAGSLDARGFKLSAPLAPADIEKKNLSTFQDNHGRVVKAAFGKGNPYWLKLKAKAQPDDAFYFADSKDEGQMYVLIRGSCIVGSLRTFIADWRRPSGFVPRRGSAYLRTLSRPLLADCVEKAENQRRAIFRQS